MCIFIYQARFKRELRLRSLPIMLPRPRLRRVRCKLATVLRWRVFTGCVSAEILRSARSSVISSDLALVDFVSLALPKSIMLASPLCEMQRFDRRMSP